MKLPIGSRADRPRIHEEAMHDAVPANAHLGKQRRILTKAVALLTTINGVEARLTAADATCTDRLEALLHGRLVPIIVQNKEISE